MSRTGDYFREQRELNLIEPTEDDYALSNCCGASFGEPGWPDNDICSKCGEHADVGEDDD